MSEEPTKADNDSRINDDTSAENAGQSANPNLAEEDTLFTSERKGLLHSDNTIKIALALIALFAAFAMKCSFLPVSNPDQSAEMPAGEQEEPRAIQLVPPQEQSPLEQSPRE